MVMKFLFAMVLAFMPGVINLFWLPTGVTTQWYVNLAKFPFTLGLNSFEIIWSIVHLLLGIGLFIIMMKAKEETDNMNKAVGLFLANIVLSAIWPFVFFRYQMITLGTISTIAILIVSYFMHKRFAMENKYAGYIVLIYILWVTFVMYMNLGMLILN